MAKAAGIAAVVEQDAPIREEELAEFLDKKITSVQKLGKNRVSLILDNGKNITLQADINDNGNPYLALEYGQRPSYPRYYCPPAGYFSNSSKISYFKASNKKTCVPIHTNGCVATGYENFTEKHMKESGCSEITPAEANALITDNCYIIRKEGFNDDTAYLILRPDNTIIKVSVTKVETPSKLPLEELQKYLLDGTYIIISDEGVDQVLPYQHRKNKPTVVPLNRG